MRIFCQACGHPCVVHDENGQCRPLIMVDASQGMGVLTPGSCECSNPVYPEIGSEAYVAARGGNTDEIDRD